MKMDRDGREEHPDPYNILYMNMFYQGISNLLPWNALIYAHSYFKERLKDVPAAENFILYFTLIFMTVKFIFLIWGIKITKRIRPDYLISAATALNVGVFGAIGVLSNIEGMDPTTFYYVILCLVLMGALCSAFVEAGYLAILSAFPSRFTQSYLVGHGFAGVVAAVLHISTALTSSSTQSEGFALLYFGVSTAIILISLILFQWTSSLSMFQYYFIRCQAHVKSQLAAHRESKDGELPIEGLLTMWQVFNQISDLVLSTSLMTFMHVMISPMLIFMTQSTQEGSTAESKFHHSFFHIFAFLISSIFDLVGKTIPAISSLAVQKLPFLPISITRILLLPIFLMGNIKGDTFDMPYSPFYASDLLFFIVIAIKSCSGGYLGTLAMMWAPLRVEPPNRAQAVTLMVYGSGTGLVLGSLAAIGLKATLKALA